MDFKNEIKTAWNRMTGGAKKVEHENAVKKMVNAIKNQHSLYRKEIKDWKFARYHALATEQPRRKKLIDLYEDILTDAFIFGRSETRKLRISNKGFIIKNAAGEIDEKKTKLLQKSWFNQFIKISLESVYFGYSLVYPSELDENGYIKNISLVFRDHVVPETKEILQYPYDQTGVKFDQPPYNDWCLFINNEGFLGLLDKAAPLWIFKKHSWQNWDEFEEMFGIPIRTAKVASTDKRVLAEIDKWLKDLGSAAYGRFPEDVEIDIKESSSRDSFGVFNEKRKAANEELATLFDGHAETAKDSGSRAKSGSIIESTQDLITADDETRVQFIVNDLLIPFLIKRGYPFSLDDVFEWNDNEKLSPKERLNIFLGVKKLGYKVKKEQIETELDVEIDGNIEHKKPPGGNFNPPHNHLDCGAHTESYRSFSYDMVASLSNDEKALLKRIFENPEAINWDYNEFKASHGSLLEALRRGYGNISFDMDNPDADTLYQFQNNIHRFATDKTRREVFELNKILKGSESYADFEKKARLLFPNYKKTWLQTEWDQAWGTSQMAAKYNLMMSDTEDAPYWKLSAVLDDGTTEICRGLDQKVFRKNDPESFQFLPPNHWRCRSDAEDVLEGYDGELSNLSDGIAADPEGYERMKKSGHNINWGDEKQAFSAQQSYLAGLSIQPTNVAGMTYDNYGLDSFADIGKKAAVPTWSAPLYIDKKTGMYRFENLNHLPAWVDTQALELDKKQLAQIKEGLMEPDELYWNDAGNIPELYYFKHYQSHSLKITQASVKVTRVDFLDDPDNERRGLLIHTPKKAMEDARRQYQAYRKQTWEKAGFNTKNGGYLVINKSRLAASKISKRELLKFQKEKAIADTLANAGYKIEMLEEIAGVSSPDARLNGILVDFKKTGSPKNVLKYAKKAIHKQGAERLVFEFEHETQAVYDVIEELKRKGFKAYYFFSGRKEVYKNF